MARIVGSCLVALMLAVSAAMPAGAQEANLDALTRLLPKPTGQWSSTGARSKVVAEGPSQGVIVFQVYQNGPRTVIVRYTENPPELVKRILANPDAYQYKPSEIKGREGIVKDDGSSGTVLVQLKHILVSVDWSGAADRKDAMRFVDAVDFEKLVDLK